MRAFDWLMFATVLAGYAMRKCLKPQVLEVFLRMTECLSTLAQREHSASDEVWRGIRLSVVEFLCLLELYMPKTELTIVFHLLLHAADHIRLWGPAPSYWMFPFERFLGFLSRHIKNRARVPANVTQFYRQFSYVQSQRDTIRECLQQSASGVEYHDFVFKGGASAGGSSTYGNTAVSLHGAVQERSLEADGIIYQQLCTALKWEHEKYRKMDAEFRADRESKAKSLAEWAQSRGLSEADKRIALGPNPRVQIRSMATVRGVDFRAAAIESKRNSRSSFFSFTSLDSKEVERKEYGRVLAFYDVQFAGTRQLLAQVEIYACVEDEVLSDHGEIQFALPAVDTRRVDNNRHFLPLYKITGKIILAPPDDRLDLPIAQRLTGRCFVLHYLDC